MEAGGVVFSSQCIQKPVTNNSYNVSGSDSQSNQEKILVPFSRTNGHNSDDTTDSEAMKRSYTNASESVTATECESSIVMKKAEKFAEPLVNINMEEKKNTDDMLSVPDATLSNTVSGNSCDIVVKESKKESEADTNQTFKIDNDNLVVLTTESVTKDCRNNSIHETDVDNIKKSLDFQENHSLSKGDTITVEKSPQQLIIADVHSNISVVNTNHSTVSTRTQSCLKRETTKSKVSQRGVKYFDDSSGDSDDNFETCNYSTNSKATSVIKSCKIIASSPHPGQNKQQSVNICRKSHQDSVNILSSSKLKNKSNTDQHLASRSKASNNVKPSVNAVLGPTLRNALRNNGEKMRSLTDKTQHKEGSCSKYRLRRLSKQSDLFTNEIKREKLRVTEEECFKVIGLEGIKCRFCKRQLRKDYQSLYHVRGLCKQTIASAADNMNSKHLRPSATYWSDRKLKMRKKLYSHRALQERIRKCYISLDRLTKLRGKEPLKIQSSPETSVANRRKYSRDSVNGKVSSQTVVSNARYSLDNTGSNDLNHNMENYSYSQAHPTNADIMLSDASQMEEASSDPCVCDGCGVIVPDCAWLTAHITNCPCRGVSETSDEAATDSGISSADGTDNTDSLQRFPSENSTVMNLEAVSPINAESSVGQPQNSDSTARCQDCESAGETAAQYPQHFDANSLLHYLETNSNLVEDVSAPNTFSGCETEQNALQFSFDEYGENTLSYIGKEITYEGAEMYEFIEYECDTCLLTLLNRKAALHHLQHSDHSQATVLIVYVYCCKNCTLRFRLKQDMWFHVMYLCQFSADANVPQSLTNTEDQNGFYSCTMCSKSFYAMHYLRRHMFLYHSPAVASGQLTTACSGPSETAVSQSSSWTQQAAAGTAESASSSSDLVSDPQALLDLACSMVLASPSAAVESSNAKVTSSNLAVTTVAAESCPTLDTSALSKQQEISKAISHQPMKPSETEGGEGSKTRRCAKGIVYKNVFMKCIVNYLCSVCDRDLSTKASKKDHKNSACFEAPGVRKFTYVRHYSYLCPYCGEKFPTQKFCRQHQLTRCLLIMGVKTDELNFKQLLCPFCDKKYFNIITLKGHMTLVHKMDKYSSGQQKSGNARHQADSEAKNSANFSDELLNENSNISSEDAGFSMADCEDDSID